MNCLGSHERTSGVADLARPLAGGGDAHSDSITPRRVVGGVLLASTHTLRLVAIVMKEPIWVAAVPAAAAPAATAAAPAAAAPPAAARGRVIGRPQARVGAPEHG